MSIIKVLHFFKENPKVSLIYDHRDHPFKMSACLRGGGVSPCADGQKVTVHKDQKSPSLAFFWNADGRGVGVKNGENLLTSQMDGSKSFFN